MSRNDDDVRRWTREIAQLRAKATRAGADRYLPQVTAAAEVLQEAIAMCVNLVQELAGARLESQSLMERVEHEKHQWEDLFESLPIACLCTDADGTILAANRSAALLLNVSARRLDARLLTHFVDDRGRFMDVLHTASMNGSSASAVELTVRPRERAPLAVTAQVIRRASHDPSRLLWFFIPASKMAERATTFPVPAPT